MINTPLLSYTEHGSGTPVVLLHGFLSTKTYWHKLIDLLAAKHRVIAIDLLGFGDSPKPRRADYDYSDHLLSIEATLKHANVQEPFILIGHSMGSLLALRYANLHKEDVSKLILANLPVMRNIHEVKEAVFKPSLIIKLGLSRSSHRLTWAFARFLYRIGLFPAQVATDLMGTADFVFRHTARSRFKSFHNVIAQAKIETDLASIEVQTTILQGIYDRSIYLENLKNRIHLPDHTDVKTFATGHHIPLVMPKVIADLL